MQKLIIIFSVIAAFSTNIVYAQNSNSINGDLQALSDLYNSTNGEGWKNNSGWLQGNPSSSWYGLEIDDEGRVIQLNLMENNLVGTLPNSLGNLKRVISFNVKANHLTGQIPVSIGEMEHLEYLYLAGSTNDVPTNLTSGYHPGKSSLETNTFLGSNLPAELGKLKNLKHLQISQTLVSGPLPHEWGNLTNLERLLLDGARDDGDGRKGWFTGELPSSWGNMTNLVQITLNENDDLEGVLPPSWGNMVEMRELRIRDTGVGGPIPPEWEGMASSLRSFLIRSNGTTNHTGILPAWLFDDRSPNLHTLIVSKNSFEGIESFDTANVNKITFQVLNLNTNNISMPFPNWVKQYRRMQIFSIARGNDFYGPMDDDFFTGWDRLRGFYVSGQNIGGTLPTSFGFSSSRSSTQQLEFHGCKLSGKIPDSWGGYQTEGIHHLYLHNNDLYGLIPVGIANWKWNTGRSGLRVQSNRFTYSDLIPLLNEWPSEITIQYHDQKHFPVNDYQSPVITQGEGSTATFNLSGVDINGNVYQWRRNGENLSNGGRISGANSHTLVISTIGANDAAEYTLRITNVNAPQLTESISQSITLRIGDASEALDAPGILLPKANLDDNPGSIQLLWTPVDGADMYRVQTATVNSFPGNATVTFDEIEDNSLIVEDLAYETSYFFRVMAYNDSQQSQWSETGDFTTGLAGQVEELDAPELLAADYYPEDDPDAIHLNWEPVEEATYYPVEISTDQNFPASGTSAFQENGETTLFIESLAFETTYYYRVRARNESKQSSWSKTAQFTTISQPVYSFSAPEILEPELNMDGKANSVQLNWTPVDGALNYNLQVATKEQFQPRFTTDIDGVEAASVLLENLSFDTTYYYRIKALDESRQSSWSDIAQFTTSADPAVQLTSPNTTKKKENPGKGNKDNTIELEWEEVAVADDYQLQLSTYEDFPAEETMNFDSIEGNSYSVDDLMYETTYYYRIRARKGRAYSPWSQISSTVTGPDHNRSGMEPTTGVPLDYDLDQNYPNPFNPSTQIRYSIPEATFVTIDILNIQGQRVHQLVNRMQEAGVYTVPFDARSLASGIYLYRISAGTFRHVKKMTVIK